MDLFAGVCYLSWLCFSTPNPEVSSGIYDLDIIIYQETAYTVHDHNIARVRRDDECYELGPAVHPF